MSDQQRIIPRSEADAADLDPKHPDHDPNVLVISDDEWAAWSRGEGLPKGSQGSSGKSSESR
jgi:hypothetical protein